MRSISFKTASLRPSATSLAGCKYSLRRNACRFRAFWLGGTLHGGGANVTEEWRYGVIHTYSLGWLRQEENQSLATPPDIASQFSRELQDMLGNTANGALGFHFYTGMDSKRDLRVSEASLAQS